MIINNNNNNKKLHLWEETMDAKRVETVSARVDAAVSSTGRTVMACFGSCTDNRVIYKVSFARFYRVEIIYAKEAKRKSGNLMLPRFLVKMPFTALKLLLQVEDTGLLFNWAKQTSYFGKNHNFRAFWGLKIRPNALSKGISSNFSLGEKVTMK